MSDTPIRRSTKFSSIQKEAMIDFMELNPRLRRGKFDKEFTTGMAEKLWQDLSNFLNTLPGCTKDFGQWRKTWQDLKTTVKAKSNIVDKDSKKTGGGRATGVPLSSLEERVKSLIGDTCIKGNRDIPESVINMNWRSESSKISHTQRINDDIRQNDLECSQRTSNHQSPNTTVAAPPSATNTSPPPAVIHSTGTSPVREMSLNQAEVPSSINNLRNIVSITEQTSPIRQMTSNRAASFRSNTQTDNGQNNQRRLSTSSFLSQRRSPNSPYSRQSSSLTNRATQRSSSPNSNLNVFFGRSPRRTRGSQASTKQNKPRRVATQRFEKTIEATDILVEIMQNKNEMKESYYKYKLEIMDANVKSQEKIATALADIASAMKQN